MIWVTHRAYNLATKRDVSNGIFLKNRAGEEGARAPRAVRAPGGLLTLGVETATEERSVAVARGARLLALRTCAQRVAGARVLEEVDGALAQARVPLEEVELFAAAKGPGSFTGLRSGLATLKALAQTLRRPVVGVPTLHALAHAARPAPRVVALIPAGRGEVFAQLLGVSEGGVVEELGGPEHVPPARLLERLRGSGGGLKWVGGGALKYAELIRDAAESAGLRFTQAADPAAPPAGDEWVLAPAHAGLAADVASLGQLIYKGGGASGAGDLRALYVRPSDAELKG